MIDVKKFTMAVVSLAVGVLLVLTVLIPVINDSVGSGSGDVLYTNTGDYYYNTVTNSTSTTLTFTIGENDFMEPALQMSINGGESKPILIDGTEMPAWTSEQSFDFTTLPLFTFRTSDGKYGVEGIVSIGLEDMDPEYLKIGGLMYFKMIQGSVPELHYMIGDEGEISVTLSNGSISYVFQTEDVPTQLNGTYLLGIVDDTTGEYTLTSDGPTVLDSTEFYMADWFGAASTETNAETQDTWITVGEAMAVGGYGTITDYSDLSNLSIYNFDRLNVISAEMGTIPAESGDGKILEYLLAIDENESEYYMPYFIVPVEITEGGSSISPTLASMLSVIPLIVVVGLIVGTVGYFIRRS